MMWIGSSDPGTPVLSEISFQIQPLGKVQWTSNDLDVRDNGKIINKLGIFKITANARLGRSEVGTNFFNGGVVSSSSSPAIKVRFVNFGSVSVTGGTLSFYTGGRSIGIDNPSSGLFNVETNA